MIDKQCFLPCFRIGSRYLLKDKLPPVGGKLLPGGGKVPPVCGKLPPIGGGKGLLAGMSVFEFGGGVGVTAGTCNEGE